MKTRILAKVLVVCLAVIMILGVAQVGFAQDAARKLGRGLANTVSGWLEIPKNIYDVSVESNPFVGITWGTIKGTGYAVARTGAGVFDIVTFPFPVPEGYEPIMKPEFVFGKEGASESK